MRNNTVETCKTNHELVLGIKHIPEPESCWELGAAAQRLGFSRQEQEQLKRLYSGLNNEALGKRCRKPRLCD